MSSGRQPSPGRVARYCEIDCRFRVFSRRFHVASLIHLCHLAFRNSGSLHVQFQVECEGQRSNKEPRSDEPAGS